ncbi:sensor histidine kinase, partial [Aduncisulcus paluster]
RKKLVEVSKYFDRYSEEEVKDVYEKASEIRIAYKMKEQEEKTLRSKRSSLEVNLKQAEDILRSAEKLISQVSVAMNYLAGELGGGAVSDSETSFEFGVQLLETLEHEKRKISREIH